jgi:hypothetical protein
MTEQINDLDEIMEKIKNDPIIQHIKEKIKLIRERNILKMSERK